MKKFYTMLLLAAATCGTASAQYQLANGGFEGTWEDCIPFVSGKNKAPTVGTQPTGWHAANVAGYYFISWIGGTTVVSKQEKGHTGVAAKMTNTTTMGNIIPGYMALGTPWNTANTSGQNADGGTFGGVTFTSQPDAFEFYYKYTKGKAENTQPASVVAYMWKGSTSQANVPANVANSAATVTMVNRDYNILGRQHALGGKVTKSDDFELIATIGAENEKEDEQGYRSEVLMTEVKAEWTHMVCPFTYHSAEKPEMINIIFASMENWAGKAYNENGNSLTVDDVKLLYWNTLSSLKYDGAELLEGEETAYDLSTVVYDPAKLEATAKSQFGTASVSYDDATYVATITVTREHAAAKTYTIQFARKVTATMSVSAAAGWGTFCAPFDVTVTAPRGVKAYVVTGENTNGVLELRDVTTISRAVAPTAVKIPANTPVVLKSDNDYTNTFEGAAVEGSPVVGLLTGVYTATKAPEDSYVLQNQSGHVGFYLVEPGTLVTVQPNRCYLTLPAGSNARALFFGEADLVTALDNAIIVDKPEASFDLQGRRVSVAGQKGIFIVGGRKVIK